MNALDPRCSAQPGGSARLSTVTVIGAVATSEAAIRSAARAAGWRVRMVVTLPPDRAERHSDFRDLSAAACDAGAELFHASRINDPAVVDRIAAAAPDLVLVVGWSQICGPELLRRFAGRLLGYHPAALPRLRGRAAIPWTILNAEPITAGTLFWIDEGLDSGAVFEQQFFHLSPDETAQSLYDKHLLALDRIVTRALARMRAGDAEGVPQDEVCATFAARRTPADGLIDWTRPGGQIVRLIRAVGRPYPGAYSYRAGDKITCWSAELVEGGGRYLACPGQIVERDGHLLIRTIDGLLRIDDWQTCSSKPIKLHQVLGGNGQ